MFKNNDNFGSINCDSCGVLIFEPATEAHSSPEDLCNKCIDNFTCEVCCFINCKCSEINNWLEEYREIMQDMRDRDKDSR